MWSFVDFDDLGTRKPMDRDRKIWGSSGHSSQNLSNRNMHMDAMVTRDSLSSLKILCVRACVCIYMHIHIYICIYICYTY